MSIWEMLRVAITALNTNRLRALLTTLGIIIGVAAVVSLMSLGGSVQTYINGQFETLGLDLLTATSSRPRGRSGSVAVQPLTTNDVEALTALSNVAQVVAVYQVRSTAAVGADSVNVNVQGVTANYGAVNKWNPLPTGSFITPEDIESSARVAVLGTTTVQDIFGDSSANPVGTNLLINGQVFTIIGVMEQRTAIRNDPNATILVPITTAQTRLDNAHISGKGYRVSQIQVQVASTNQMDATSQQIQNYFLKAHGIANAVAADFTISNPADVLASRSQVISLLTVLLSAIAGISLLVGGIGVMNIMLVSVSERTYEIGLRKALGAQSSDILGQFLLESILIALVGGFVGVIFSWVILQLAGGLLPGVEVTVTPESVLLATGVSSLIGILSGLYPARRAAIMHPIQALRSE